MPTSNRPDAHGAAPLPTKIEDNTLDEQHAGIPELTFPVTDNDQSSESGQTHVAGEPDAERKGRPVGVGR